MSQLGTQKEVACNRSVAAPDNDLAPWLTEHLDGLEKALRADWDVR
jgi:hypothetical protein